MKKLNTKGFSTVELLLVVLVVLVLGLGGYYVWHTQKNDLPQSTNTDIGGPAVGHVVTKEINLVTGTYSPTTIDIKKGTTVTWKISDTGEIPNYGIENNTDSTEIFSSPLLKSGDKFSHTFNTIGTFGWHDKYQGGTTGTITVTE